MDHAREQLTSSLFDHVMYCRHWQLVKEPDHTAQQEIQDEILEQPDFITAYMV